MSGKTVGNDLRALSIAIALVGAAALSSAEAQAPQAAVRVGYGHSDNIGRHPFTEVPATFPLVGLRFDVEGERPGVSGMLIGNVELRDYSNADLVVDDEVVGSIDGELAVDLVRDRVLWEFEANAGQGRTNPLAPTEPENRQRVRIVSTGPRAILPLGRRHSLEVSARKSSREFEDTDLLDAQDLRFDVDLWRALSSNSHVGIGFESSEVRYENENQDYEFHSVVVTYRKQLASGDAELAVGRGEIAIDSEAGSTPATLARIGWGRDIGARSRVNLLAVKELTDAGRLFQSVGHEGFGLTGTFLEYGNAGLFPTLGGIGDSRLRDVILSLDPLERTGIRAGIEISGQRTQFAASFGLSEDRFEKDNLLDNDAAHLSVSLRREFGLRWDLRMTWLQVRQDFDQVDQIRSDALARLTLGRTFGRSTKIELALERSKSRDTSDLAYEENVYILHFTYVLQRQ